VRASCRRGGPRRSHRPTSRANCDWRAQRLPDVALQAGTSVPSTVRRHPRRLDSSSRLATHAAERPRGGSRDVSRARAFDPYFARRGAASAPARRACAQVSARAWGCGEARRLGAQTAGRACRGRSRRRRAPCAARPRAARRGSSKVSSMCLRASSTRSRSSRLESGWRRVRVNRRRLRRAWGSRRDAHLRRRRRRRTRAASRRWGPVRGRAGRAAVGRRGPRTGRR